MNHLTTELGFRSGEIRKTEENRLLWYSFGIRARQLLKDTVKVQLDDVKDFEFLQIACQTALDKLEEDLKNFVVNHPD
jgi:hypothetical protein